MKVELLASPPVSGSLPERAYGHQGAATWVRFAPDEGDAWLGAFCDQGPSLYETATAFADNCTVFVIARGQGYVVDGCSGQLLHRTDWDYFYFAVPVPERDYVVACDNLRLFEVGADGVRWRSERIATDGVVLDGATATQVRGKLWMAYGPEGWYAFTLDLATRKVERGPWLTDDFNRFVPGAA